MLNPQLCTGEDLKIKQLRPNNAQVEIRIEQLARHTVARNHWSKDFKNYTIYTIHYKSFSDNLVFQRNSMSKLERDSCNKEQIDHAACRLKHSVICEREEVSSICQAVDENTIGQINQGSQACISSFSDAFQSSPLGLERKMLQEGKIFTISCAEALPESGRIPVYLGNSHQADAGETSSSPYEALPSTIFNRVEYLENSIRLVESQLELRANARALELQQPLLAENRRLKADLKEALYIAWCFQRELGLARPEVASPADGSRQHPATHLSRRPSESEALNSQHLPHTPEWPQRPHQPSPSQPFRPVPDSHCQYAAPAAGTAGCLIGGGLSPADPDLVAAELAARLRGLEATNAALSDRVRQLESLLGVPASPDRDHERLDSSSCCAPGPADCVEPVRATVRLRDIVGQLPPGRPSLSPGGAAGCQV